MKRWPVIACVWLCAGMLAQAVVGYGLYLPRFGERDEPWPKERLAGWPVPVPQSWKTSGRGRTTTLYRNFNSAGWGWDWTQYNVAGGDGYQTVFATRIGWPARSLAAYTHMESSDGRVWSEPVGWVPAWKSVLMRGEFKLFDGGLRRAWPVYPLWGGMAINALVFGAGLATLWLAIGRAGQRWRVRRGECPGCGYPIGVADRCTECGRELPRWVVRMRGAASR